MRTGTTRYVPTVTNSPRSVLETFGNQRLKQNATQVCARRDTATLLVALAKIRCHTEMSCRYDEQPWKCLHATHPRNSYAAGTSVSWIYAFSFTTSTKVWHIAFPKLLDANVPHVTSSTHKSPTILLSQTVGHNAQSSMLLPRYFRLFFSRTFSLAVVWLELFYWALSRHVTFVYRRLRMCKETGPSPNHCYILFLPCLCMPGGTGQTCFKRKGRIMKPTWLYKHYKMITTKSVTYFDHKSEAASWAMTNIVNFVFAIPLRTLIIAQVHKESLNWPLDRKILNANLSNVFVSLQILRITLCAR